MPSYNPYNTDSQDPTNFSSNVINRGFFNKILRSLSNFGLDFNKMSNQNSYSISVFEDPNGPGRGSSEPQNTYDAFTKQVIANILNKKSIAYLDRSYEDKRKILRQYCLKDEIKDFLTTISDETIIYDDDNYFCYVEDLPDDMDETIKQKYRDNFNQIIRSFGFDDGTTAWNYLKHLLIDGFIAYEIVYDSKQKNVTKLIPIDPISIIPATDPATQTVVWVQYPNDAQRKRVLLDSQIVYISWSNNNEYAETSYVENLIKPYNQLKLIEQTRQLYNINQAAIYKKFTIPTNGLSRQMAEQRIQTLLSEYHETIQWDDQLGTVSINGSNDVPHSKDYWFPSNEGTGPNIEILKPENNDLNEDSMLQWFYNKLKKASRIPFSRFEDDQGGGTFASDNSELTRDEAKFNNFVSRIRTIFKEIIIKPLKIQMILDFPELKDDPYFHANVKLNFNKNNLFEKWKYLNNLSKKSDVVASLTSNLQDAEGNSYIPIEWLMRHIMEFTEQEIEEMERYRFNGQSSASSQGQGGQVQGGQGEISPEGGQEELGGQAQGGQAQGGQAQGGQAQGGQTQGGEELGQEEF